MMQSCASAAKLRAAGPFSRSASSARFEYRIPPPRIVSSAVVQRERRMVLSDMLVPVCPFRTLDARRRPPRLTLNPGKHAGDEPARLAHLDDGYDRAILVQGDEGSAQSLPRRRPGSFGWGIAALHRLNAATKLPFPRRPPHSVSRSPRARE